MSTQKDWAHKFEQSHDTLLAPEVAPATSEPTTAGRVPPTAIRSHISSERGVSRPVRRRSRTSRRAPTTMLTTDTTNFRAMVQQFTGGPCASFTIGSNQNSRAFSGFTIGFGQAAQPDQFQHNEIPQQYFVSSEKYNVQHQHMKLVQDPTIFSMGPDSTFDDQFVLHQNHQNLRHDIPQFAASGFGGDLVVDSSSSSENRRINTSMF